MIFCLIELCLQPSAQNVTFISDTDLQKRDHLLMRGHLPLLFFMTMVSRCVSLLQPSTSEKELHWPFAFFKNEIVMCLVFQRMCAIWILCIHRATLHGGFYKRVLLYRCCDYPQIKKIH